MEYTSFVNLEPAKFSTFREALKDLISRVKVVASSGTVYSQLLETACGIAVSAPNLPILNNRAIYFYDARDFGFKTGLLRDSSVFVEEASEPDTPLLMNLFTAFDVRHFVESLPEKSPV